MTWKKTLGTRLPAAVSTTIGDAMNKKLLALYLGIFLIVGAVQAIPYARSLVSQAELDRLELESKDHRRVSEQSMLQDGIFDFNKR